ncbi:PREDICTED: LOW QUALITY PROTEIN, partial [Prunus dulcis]
SVDSFDNSNSDREEEMAGNNDDNRALEDYAQLVIPNSPSCILLPTEARNYDLKSSHLHMLPSFYGLPNEDPLAHIKEFYNVVSGLPLQGVSEANMRMRVFPYTLKDRAKGWLMTLAPGSLTTWDAVAKKFLEKFFSTQKTATLRGQIFNFKQDDGEPFNECWERFKGLLLQCPHHGLPLYLQMQIFYDGLTQTCQSTVDNAAGGALKKKNAQESYNIYEMLGSNAQHKDTRGPTQEENEKPNDDPSNATSSFEAPNFHKAEKPYSPPIPFPGRLAKSKQDKSFKEIFDILSKVNVNLPLLDVIRNMPAYGKFFKELNTYKRKYGPNEKVMVSENVSAVLQRKLPPKLKDPGSFSINITIGDKLVEKAMLDLGASINLMPYSVYLQLGLGGLKATTISLQLADRSVKYPRGIVEDILVQVDKLILPADFVVLDMEEAPLHDRELPILLGRPFMATAKTIIDVQNGLLTMTVLGETVQFKVFESLSHPSSSIDCCSIDVLDSLVFSKFLLAQSNDPLQYVLSQSQNDFDEEVLMEMVAALEALKPYPSTFSPLIEPLEPSATHLIPSIVKPPKLDLKPLPSHLKYAYLAEFETLPVIIASDLTPLEEDKLIRVLKEFKSAIGWSIADIKGISPTMCMHRILLEEGAKPTREPQRRLNPHMKEVRIGITVVKNEHKELVQTRPAASWRVCTDYRKLNSDTRKDYFPMPFIDQMLERLAGHSYYCFLDGYSGYNQIVIAPEDQEKTTFTCPFGTFAYRRMPFGLCNAPATFQRCMLAIFSDMIERFIEVFMDDFSVFGSSFDNCLNHLSLVLQRCQETNLILNWEKCQFMVKQGVVLGHVISNKGIEVDKAKIDIISNMAAPASVKGGRSFLGHAGFYRRFIKDFSKITHPLCNLLAKDVVFHFDKDCMNAFNTLKHELTSAPIIMAPDWSLPFELMCDASDYAIGAVLGQRVNKLPHVIYYASRTLNDAQLNYSTTEKELLAVVFALEKFRSYLVGSKVIVYSDHAALRFLLTKKDAKP